MTLPKLRLYQKHMMFGMKNKLVSAWSNTVSKIFKSKFCSLISYQGKNIGNINKIIQFWVYFCTLQINVVWCKCNITGDTFFKIQYTKHGFVTKKWITIHLNVKGINSIATCKFFQIRESTRKFPPFHILK